MMVAWQTGKRRRDARRGPLSVPLALETVGCAEPAVPTNPTKPFFFLETQASNYTGSSVFCRRQPGILTSGIGMTEQSRAHLKERWERIKNTNNSCRPLSDGRSGAGESDDVGFGFSSVSRHSSLRGQHLV